MRKKEEGIFDSLKYKIPKSAANITVSYAVAKTTYDKTQSNSVAVCAMYTTYHGLKIIEALIEDFIRNKVLDMKLSKN